MKPIAHYSFTGLITSRKQVIICNNASLQPKKRQKFNNNFNICQFFSEFILLCFSLLQSVIYMLLMYYIYYRFFKRLAFNYSITSALLTLKIIQLVAEINDSRGKNVFSFNGKFSGSSPCLFRLNASL